MTTYYSLLDSVRFSGETPVATRETRRLSALATVTTDLIVQRKRVVLSQSQVFDGSLLLSVGEAARHDKAFVPEFRSLRQLIKDNWVQTRILDTAALRKQHSEAETFTVQNAFASAIASGFRFSAWPELNGNPELAREVLSCLDGGRDDSLPVALRERLDVLREIDEAFRRSSASERAVPAPGAPLGRRIVDHISSTQVSKSTAVVYEGTTALWQALRDRDRGAYERSINMRSAWYDLLDQYSESAEVSPHHGGVATLRSIVDHHYNSIVARSLGADSCTDESEDLLLPGVLRDGGISNESRGIASFLTDSSSTVHGSLTWELARERLRADGEFDVLTPEERLNDLLDLEVAQRVDHDRLVLSVRVVPTIVNFVASFAAGSAVQGAMGTSAPGSPQWIGGVVVGGVIGAVAAREVAPSMPPLRALDKLASRIEEARASRIRESLIVKTRASAPPRR